MALCLYPRRSQPAACLGSPGCHPVGGIACQAYSACSQWCVRRRACDSDARQWQSRDVKAGGSGRAIAVLRGWSCCAAWSGWCWRVCCWWGSGGGMREGRGGLACDFDALCDFDRRIRMSESHEASISHVISADGPGPGQAGGAGVADMAEVACAAGRSRARGGYREKRPRTGFTRSASMSKPAVLRPRHFPNCPLVRSADARLDDQAQRHCARGHNPYAAQGTVWARISPARWPSRRPCA